MKRSELEHILRASAAITGSDQFVVIGSQAILGQFDNPPAELLVSMEADLFSLRSPDDADLIEGSIGEASPFHRTFGYHAHGVGVNTAILPRGWQERLVPLRTANTGVATGLCLEVHDLAVSKLVAGRPKDLDYLSVLFRRALAKPDIVATRLVSTPLSDDQQAACAARLRRLTE